MLDIRCSISTGSSSQWQPGAVLRQTARFKASVKGCTCRRALRALAHRRHAHHAIERLKVGARAAPVSLAASVSAVSTAEQPEASKTQVEESVLQELLIWLVNNGVTGIGCDDSKVALYQDTDADRGIVAVEDIPVGAELIRVPLRLAITDVMDEQQKSQLVRQGSYWQDRLVAKLLHEAQQGRQSAWYPYIRALPKSVPSALESFTESEAQQVQLPEVCTAIQSHAEKMSASWQACRPDAISGADLHTYRWAHSCVMSRTFGNAAQTGGIGVRMMVPLIDMLNHAGDETESGLLSDTPVARDNVRWDVVSPQNSLDNCWEMVLSSTQHIHAQTPLLLSYFEGSNDEFLLHYGFVPASNPHDSWQLFSTVAEALEHLWWQDLAQGKAAVGLCAVYKQALDVGVEALQQEVAAAAAAAGSADGGNWGHLLDALEPIKIASGCRISNSLVAALEVMHGGDLSAVEAAVAGVAWQQLRAMPTSLLYDLALLAADAIQTDKNDGDAAQRYCSLLRHYAQALLPNYDPELYQQLAAATAAAGSILSRGARSTQPPPSPSAAPATNKRQNVVPGPATVPATTESAAAQESHLNMGDLSLDLLLSFLLQSGHQQHVGESLTAALRSAVKFRVSKKLLLVDVVLAARTPLADLQQQQQLATKAAAMRAEQAGESNALPWQR